MTFSWNYIFSHLGIIRGGAMLVGLLSLRPLNPLFHPETVEELKSLGSSVRLFGVIVILYSVYASRAFLLLFSFKCKLLRHALKEWNARFREIMMTSSSFEGRKKQISGKMRYSQTAYCPIIDEL